MLVYVFVTFKAIAMFVVKHLNEVSNFKICSSSVLIARIRKDDVGPNTTYCFEYASLEVLLSR
jgi:hypothetical protein